MEAKSGSFKQNLPDILKDLQPGTGYEKEEVFDGEVSEPEIKELASNHIDHANLSDNFDRGELEREFKKAYAEACSQKFHAHDIQDVNATREFSMIDRALLHGLDMAEVGEDYAIALYAKDAVELRHSEEYGEEIDQGNITWQEAIDELKESETGFRGLKIDWERMREKDGFQIDSLSDEEIILADGETVKYNEDVTPYLGDWNLVYQAFRREYSRLLEPFYDNHELEEEATRAGLRRTMLWRDHKVESQDNDNDYKRHIEDAITPEAKAATGNLSYGELPDDSKGQKGKSVYSNFYELGIRGHDKRDKEAAFVGAKGLAGEVAKELSEEELRNRLLV